MPKPVSSDSWNLALIVRDHYGTDQLGMVGAEIGVNTGQLSEKLLQTFPQLMLFMIDPWVALGSDPHYAGSHWEKLTDAQRETSMRRALEVTDFANHRRVVIKETSLVAAGLISKMFDWVFIDACHHYDCVSKDITAWWPLVKPGGFMSGHDYRHHKNKTGQFGVDRAVHEFAHHSELPLKVKGACWWFEKH